MAARRLAYGVSCAQEEVGCRHGLGVETDIRSDMLQVEDDFAATNRKWDAFDKQVEDGNAKAEELSARFGPWYYVISEELFQKLKPSREDLVKKPEDQGGDK